MTPPRRRVLPVALALGLLLLASSWALPGEEDADLARRGPALVRAVQDALLKVEIELRHDGGEAPSALNDPSNWSVDEDELDQLISEKRSLDLAGFLVAPDRVVVPDVQLHPRFVAAWRVRFGGHVTPARPCAWLKQYNGAILALDAPLPGTRPLVFDAAAPLPYHALYYGRSQGRWMVAVRPTFSQLDVWEDGRHTLATWFCALILAGEGTPVGVALDDDLPVDGSWRGNPLTWPLVDGRELEAIEEAVAARSTAGLLHACLRFRSPREDAAGAYAFGEWGAEEGEGEQDTERHATALLLDATRVLVLAALPPRVTARLESVGVTLPGGQAVGARFDASLEDYGAFLATLDRPLAGALTLAVRPLAEELESLLVVHRLTHRGEQRVSYLSHARLHWLQTGWEGRVYPHVDGLQEDQFLFDPEGRLLAFPLSLRALPPERWRPPPVLLLPTEYLAALLGDLDGHVDGSNVPLSEAEEVRLAWLGVELQPLDQELARANQVSHLTRDGETGALVSFVYAHSPALAAGIEVGAILLRVHSPDRPRPIEIDAGRDGFPDGMGLPDAVPEEVRDRGPRWRPWPSVENSLNRQITALGFGRPFSVELVQGGEVRRPDFVVTEGPTHFEAAPRFASEALGATVRDLTYEVRRYFQLGADEPGVIVSEVLPGQRAAVAGLLPFEIVVRVDDHPVRDVQAFEAALVGEGEVRLTVKDRLRERIVKVRREGP